MYQFSLTGAAGYVAPRHMKAIMETGNDLVSVYDIHDTLGVLDQYFPNARCFSSEAAYRAFHEHQSPDYVSVCSPNHLHFDHISWALQWGANVICEKPLVVEPSHLDRLTQMESDSGKKVFTILQLRLLPNVMALREQILNNDLRYAVEVDYVSARGNWYFNSWKGKDELSGGLVTNIGIHLFDLLIWLFGPVEKVEIGNYSSRTAEGKLELTRASVKWRLSIDANQLPAASLAAGKRTFREIRVDGERLPLDNGINELHTSCYRQILRGEAPGIREAAPSIVLCRQLRQLMH